MNTLKEVGKNIKYEFISFLILLTISFPNIINGPIYVPDSMGYIEHVFYVSPGYPLFISFFEILGFDSLYFLTFVQVAINLAAILYFLRFLINILKLPSAIILGFLPIGLYWLLIDKASYIQPYSIMTESVSFPIFLIISVFLIKSLMQHSFRFLGVATILNGLLILFRGQFIIMYPIFILVALYFLYRRKQIKSILVYLILLFAVFTIHSVTERVINYTQTGYYGKTSLTQMALASNAIYLSNSSDAELFQDDVDRELFLKIHDLASNSDYLLENYSTQTNDITRNQIDIDTNNNDSKNSSGLTAKIEHYNHHFNYILFHSVRRVLLDYYSEIDSVFERWEIANKRSKEIAEVLIRQHFKNYLLYQSGDIFVHGFNSFLELIVFVLLLIFSLYFAIFYNNKLALTVFLFSIIHVLTLLASTIGGRVLFRYTIYTHFVLSSIILLLLLKSFYDKKYNI